jgi:holo-[acyl-carrier protein] synthase
MGIGRFGMTVGLGVDLVNTTRFQNILTKNNNYVDRFVTRILHPNERSRFYEQKRPEQSINLLAGSWAAKEALFKTLDTKHQKVFRFNQWYRGYKEGKPTITSDEYNEDEEFLLSVSHDGDMLVASVIRIAYMSSPYELSSPSGL